MAGTSLIVLCLAFGSLRSGAALDSSPPQDASNGGNGGNLRAITSQIVQRPEVNQSLIVCNAYAYEKPIDVFRVRSLVQANKKGSIPYKQCQDVVVPLAEGDQLDFKAGELDVGTFLAHGLPKRRSTLLLIPHRRDPLTMAVSFESHAFAELETAQVAVVDAYRGKGVSTVKIKDVVDLKKEQGSAGEKGAILTQRVEDLRYSSIVALSPGRYEIGLASSAASSANATAFQQMSVTGKEKYVVMRVGVEGNEDAATEAARTAYPQELVVFLGAAPPRVAGLGLWALVGLLAAAWGAARNAA